METLKFIFSRSNILFALSLLIGFFFPQAASISVLLILPALMLIMTITPLKIPRGFFRRPKKLIVWAIYGNLMSYLLLGNIIIFTGVFFLREEAFLLGMVLIAAMPPAVNMLSLSKTLRGDSTNSIAGFAGAYLGALVIAPLLGLVFFRYSQMDYWLVLMIFLALVALPLALSRLAVENDWDKITEPYEGWIIDCCFFIVFYTIAAKCRPLLFDWSYDMTLIIILAAAIVFGLPFAINKTGRIFNRGKNKITPMLLLGTLKNHGLAGGIAVVVFPAEIAFAALVFALMSFIFANIVLYMKARKSSA
ncbi:MAG TPA: hypothetical protein ENN23_01860 [Deltaproteobacteria bacterium]|nr:hypothetical protein [Deltaproteobacteria bacterium]